MSLGFIENSGCFSNRKLSFRCQRTFVVFRVFEFARAGWPIFCSPAVLVMLVVEGGLSHPTETTWFVLTQFEAANCLEEKMGARITAAFCFCFCFGCWLLVVGGRKKNKGRFCTLHQQLSDNGNDKHGSRQADTGCQSVFDS